MSLPGAGTSFEDAIKAASSSTEPVAVPLPDGTEVRVLPPMKWRQSAMRAARAGDLDGWAQIVIVADDEQNGPAVWVEADLTNEELIAFISAYAERAGQHPGK